MKGKQRCKILKEIRQRIADANDIEFITSECQHKGDCLGTCPKCEAELRYLERELEKRQRLGKTVVVAGLTAIIATSAVGCDDWFGTKELGGEPLPPDNYVYELDGDVPLPPDIPGGMLPPEEVELGGDPLPDPITVLEVVDSNLTAEELTDALMRGVTRDGLYNSLGWAELFISTDESGNDIYRCPIEGYETMTVIYQREGNGWDYIVDVQFHTPTDASDGAVVLPEDEFS